MEGQQPQLLMEATPPSTRDGEATPPTSEPPFKPGRTEWAIMFTLSLASLVVALDSTILIAALPELAASLHADTTSTFWAGSGYLLPYAVVQPLLVCLSDVFGRRPLLLLSLVFFLAGSIPCAMAQNMTTFLIGRVIQGIGGGGVVALSQAIFADMLPLRIRPKYFAITVQIAWALGTIVGPVLGGVLAEHGSLSHLSKYSDGWCWIFWLNLPVAMLSIIFTLLLINLDPADCTLSTREKLRTIDYRGMFLFPCALTSILLAISWGGTQHVWSSLATLLPLLLGSGLLAAFIANSVWKKTQYPMLPRSVFSNRSTAILFIVTFLYGTTLFMALYYICFYFSCVQLHGPTQSGADVIAALAFSLPTSVFVGIAITKLGSFRWAIWTGNAIETLGYGLLLLLDEHTGKVKWAGILAVVGIGTGMSLSSCAVGVQSSTTTDRQSANSAVVYTFLRSLGMCVGVAIGSSIFQNVAGNKLLELGLENRYARDAEAFVFTTLRFVKEGDVVRAQVLSAFVHGLRAVWLVTTVVKGCSLAMSLGIREASMDRGLNGKFRVGRGRKAEAEVESA